MVTVTDKDSCQSICNFTLFGPGELGDFVWFDENENGIQDIGESGIEGVEIEVEGTDVYGNDLLQSTMSDAQGIYQFILLPGNYQLTFNSPAGLVPSLQDAGADDGEDSDANQLTNTTIIYSLGSGEVNQTIDAGFIGSQPCDNVTDAGSICCDQSLCGPGIAPMPVLNSQEPSGGSGDLQYLWFFHNEPVPFDPGIWTPVIDATEPDFEPSAVDETTYYVRAVRRSGCIEFLATDPISLSIDSIAVAAIDGPEATCFTDPVSFAAFDNGPGASYFWTFEDGEPETAESRIINGVSWSTFGMKNVTLSVEKDGCISTDTLVFTVSNTPTYCGNALILAGREISPNIIQLDWFYEESDTVDRFYEVEWAWQDSTDFTSLGEPDSTFSGGLFNQYFLTHDEPRRGSNFYRVRLKDSDGTELLSNTVEIRPVGQFDLTYVYPNPFQDFLRVEIIDRFDLPISLEMYNIYGQKVFSVDADPDISLFEIPTHEIGPGNYFLWVKYDGKVQKLFKLVKVR